LAIFIVATIFVYIFGVIGRVFGWFRFAVVVLVATVTAVYRVHAQNPNRSR